MYVNQSGALLFSAGENHRPRTSIPLRFHCIGRSSHSRIPCNVDKQVFFPEISSLFIYIICSVLLYYRPPLFSFITFFFSDFPMQYLVLFLIIFYLPPISMSFKIFSVIQFCLFFSELLLVFVPLLLI